MPENNTMNDSTSQINHNHSNIEQLAYYLKKKTVWAFDRVHFIQPGLPFYNAMLSWCSLTRKMRNPYISLVPKFWWLSLSEWMVRPCPWWCVMMVLHWCLESGDVTQPGDCQWLTTGQHQASWSDRMYSSWSVFSVFLSFFQSYFSCRVSSDSQLGSDNPAGVSECTIVHQAAEAFFTLGK